ncbi:MAG: heavy metal translocating P-type ATPase, partial [Candidatus Corynebacterium faecigallinarum]
NGSGTLTVTATADGGDNSLTQIVRLVEQAHATKGERARLADRIARPLVPLVLVAAALIAGIGALLGDPGVWVERALVVLVAASPCALAIAVPVTVISAIGSASKFGVVIKSGEALEQFGMIRTVAFDKTGTLTRNEPRVVEVRSSGNRSELDVLTLAAALEASSSHPLAQAVTTAVPVTVGAREFPQVTTVHEEPGHGMSGILHPTLAGHPDDLDGDDSGLPVRVGGPRWIDPADMATDTEEMARQGMSLIVVEVDGEVHGVIGIRDELRPEAAETIAALHAQDVTTMMLTGDNERTATALATDAGIDRIHADQLPSDKARHVQESAAHIPTAMIGDGINDAPALATATVGIAMGASGSAAAIESADIAFTGNDLRLIPAALAHASRGRRIMTGNIILALAIIVVLFPLALFGVLGLAAVVLVHEIAEVVVIGNGLRAARSSDVVRSPTTPTTQATSPA